MKIFLWFISISFSLNQKRIKNENKKNFRIKDTRKAFLLSTNQNYQAQLMQQLLINDQLMAQNTNNQILYERLRAESARINKLIQTLKRIMK